jgi:hypothetical protein
MKPEHDARRTIIREWMSLPRDLRSTQEQVAAFASKAVEKHKLHGGANPRKRVVAWLSPRRGKP